jgi:hypothetical protein
MTKNNDYHMTTSINGGLFVWRGTTMIGVADDETSACKLARADRFGVPEWVPIDLAGTLYLIAHAFAGSIMLVGLWVGNTELTIAGAAIYLHAGRNLK